MTNSKSHVVQEFIDRDIPLQSPLGPTWLGLAKSRLGAS